MVESAVQVKPGRYGEICSTREVSLWVYIGDMDSQSGGMAAMTLQAVGGGNL